MDGWMDRARYHRRLQLYLSWCYFFFPWQLPGSPFFGLMVVFDFWGFLLFSLVQSCKLSLLVVVRLVY